MQKISTVRIVNFLLESRQTPSIRIFVFIEKWVDLLILLEVRELCVVTDFKEWWSEFRKPFRFDYRNLIIRWYAWCIVKRYTSIVKIFKTWSPPAYIPLWSLRVHGTQPIQADFGIENLRDVCRRLDHQGVFDNPLVDLALQSFWRNQSKLPSEVVERLCRN